MADLRDIQLCELEILNDVTNYCDKYNIKYWLAGGTMLGAVRHKGFIPWDDDVDIYMTVDGIKNFLKHARHLNEKGYFVSSQLSGSHFLFLKIRKKHTYMPKKDQEVNMAKYCDDGYFGVWIDIIPLIDFSNDKEIQKKQIDDLYRLQQISMKYRKYPTGGLVKKSLKRVYNALLFPVLAYYWRRILKVGRNNSDYYLHVSISFFRIQRKKIY